MTFPPRSTAPRTASLAVPRPRLRGSPFSLSNSRYNKINQFQVALLRIGTPIPFLPPSHRSRGINSTGGGKRKMDDIEKLATFVANSARDKRRPGAEYYLVYNPACHDKCKKRRHL